MDIGGWLSALGLEEYREAFEANRVSADLLPDLTDQDLRALGVAALGDRKRLLAAIAGLSAPDVAAAVADNRAGERRQVTVLFADIAGFTGLSERLGAEATHDLLNRYFAAADRIIEEFGGAVDKHIGDNVMAVFGAPVAHDNDPERALRAALAIHESVKGINTPDGPMRLHIGLASGQVVASGTGSDSHREYTVTGETVNLAARLEAMAEPGQTLISQAVHQRTTGLASVVALGPQQIKGIARPVAIWRVEGLAEAHRAPRTPFVGRHSEIGQCRAILDQIGATGLGQVLVVRGAAGIGKTRLTDELIRAAAAQGFAVHRCLVLDFGSQKGQAGVPALVRSLVGVPGHSTAQTRAAAADAAVETGGCAEPGRMFLNDYLDLLQPLELRRVFDAMDERARRAGRQAVLRELIAWAGGGRPQLILIEDLHWADARTLEDLAAVAETAISHPVALIATTRPESDPLDGPWRALSTDHPVSIINLGPLRASEAREMATGFGQANQDRLAECLERAAGNPLFLEQLLQNAAESASDLVPGSIQSLVLARMDRLALPDRQALQAASVFGQRFSPDALRYLVGKPDYDCAELLAHQLVRPEGADFLFAHALIRDGVYESILTAPRTQLHARAAEWFADKDPILHAEHLRMAGDAGAPLAYLAAAQGELDSYRSDRAIALLETGQSVAEPHDRVALALALGQAQHDAGALSQARAAFDAALEAATEDAERCRALLGLAAVKRITEDVEGALRDLDPALAAAERLGMTEDAARAHFLRGNLLFPSGDIEGCRREHGRALQLARDAGVAELEAAALGGLADAEYLSGRFRSANRLFTECVEIARAKGFGRIEVANLPMIGVTADWAGESDSTLPIAHEALEAADRVGNARAKLVALDNIHFLYRSRGDFARSRDYGEQALELARHLGARRFESELLAFLGYLDFQEGHLADGLEKARAGIAIHRENFPDMAFMGPALLGLLMLTTDEASERASACEEAECLLAAGAVSHNHCYFRMFAIDACLRTGDFDGAEHHARALIDFMPEERLLTLEFISARGLVLARVGRGEATPEVGAEIDRLIELGTVLHQRVPMRALETARATLGTA